MTNLTPMLTLLIRQFNTNVFKKLPFLLLLVVFIIVSSECPNSCSGHGKCGAYDSCACFRGFTGGDCAQRVCQFGLAHVDIPKGDLDASGSVTGPDHLVIRGSDLYPAGTQELFPNMVNSNNTVLENTAHSYVECSNKGFCDRLTGLCTCIEGYEGSACQRTSCPSVDLNKPCSGHGTCESASTLARLDGGNVYALWDADITMGCRCDPGYYGLDCSTKRCKVGFDPVYADPDNSHRYSNWSLVIYTRSQSARVIGNFSLQFYDSFGMRWSTNPITYGATCLDLIKAFDDLPHRVLPLNSVACLRWTNYQAITIRDEPVVISPNPFFGIKYTLAFPGNPGKLKQLTTNIYLDGSRPTLQSTESDKSTLGMFVYPNGFSGEYLEHFTEKCVGVDVTIQSTTTYNYLSGLTSLEFRLLCQCLGAASTLDPIISGRVKGVSYAWDYGTVYNPHLVRLVDKTRPVVTDLCPGVDSVRGEGTTCTLSKPPGFFTAMYYNTGLKVFVLMTRPAEDYSKTNQFTIFTTNGTTQMVSETARIFTDSERPYSKTIYSINSTDAYPGFLGNIDCETSEPNINGAFTCIEKDNIVFFLEPRQFLFNPKYMNLYTVERLYTADASINPYGTDRHRIQLDMSINSAWDRIGLANARAYVFYPAGTYKVVSECSNRGLCDINGDCDCFTSYSGGTCGELNNLLA